MVPAEEKQIRFFLYRFHLLPLMGVDSQLQLFPDTTLGIEEIKARKNEFFADILVKLTEIPSNTTPLKLHYKDEALYVFKIANKKTTQITRNFKKEVIEDEPYTFIIINNDPEVQKIAISNNSDAFSRPDTVKNNLKKILQTELRKFELNIEIEAIFNTLEFWKFVEKHQHTLKYINFEFIRPNLASISSTLSDDFKKFTEQTNSHTSNIILKAPENGTLTNIERENADLNGLVQYSGNGGGGITVKIRKSRKTYNTKKNQETTQINEYTIENATSDFLNLIKSIVK